MLHKIIEEKEGQQDVSNQNGTILLKRDSWRLSQKQLLESGYQR